MKARRTAAVLGILFLQAFLVIQHAAARVIPKTGSDNGNPGAPVLPGLHDLDLDRSLEDKYFHEPVGHEKGADDRLGHYDSRYFRGMVTDAERMDTLTHMVRAYLQFADAHGLETWIAHGTLLGWWWNGKLLPWDWDIDAQVLDTTLARMGREFNQTLAIFTDDRNNTREYLLDVNPWAYFRDRGPGHNIIDARWIDTRSGLYIDITGLSVLQPDKAPDVWECKNRHKYRTEDLYPMRRSTFEGMSALIPYNYQDILTEEYGDKALAKTAFLAHTWDPNKGLWVPDY
ncbi:hypothetical protein VTN49DRAFT_841 [Thermomyces lanuginosus]|uniref:uncharacterized protein n=1 Tax=Thermomyces lanuginosus TaxID=5541 RepID=UPI003743AB4A